MPTINGRACVVNGKPVDKVYSNGKIVYGRNLLLGTAQPLSLLTDNWASGIYSLDPKYQGGIVTLSFDIELKGITDFSAYKGPIIRVSLSNEWGSDVATFELQPNYPIDNRWIVTKADPTHWHMSITINAKYDDKNTFPTEGVLFLYARASGGITTGPIVSKSILTEGTDLVPWTPAPEDVM